jgi:anthranilate synthase component 1
MTRFSPNFETFQRLAASSDLVPVYRQLVSDTLTPVSAYCRIQQGACAFLFESVIGGERIGRYSFLGADPFLQINAYDRRVEVTGPNGTETREVDDPLAELEKLLAGFRAVHLPGLPRFCGGAVGYAGYDTVRYTEKLPNAPEDDRRLPDLSFAFYDRMVIFDQINKTILVVAHARTKSGDLRAEYESACRRVDETCAQLARPTDGLVPG